MLQYLYVKEIFFSFGLGIRDNENDGDFYSVGFAP